MVDTGGRGLTTGVAERYPRWTAIFLTLFAGVMVVLLPLEKFPDRVKHDPVPAVAAYLILATIAVIVGCFRGWRMGLLIDQHGVTVRNYFRSYRFGWSEVKCFTD